MKCVKKKIKSDFRNSVADFRSSKAMCVQLIATVRVSRVKEFNYVLSLREIHHSPDKGLMELRGNVEE